MHILRQTQAMFWSNKLKAGNMGMFTSYDIEYVAKFLGFERIQSEIKELEGKATMGIPFREFFEKEGYLGYKSVFYIFQLLVQYFKNDGDDLGEFLFKSRTRYTLDNYYEGRNLKAHRVEEQKNIQYIIENGIGKEENYKDFKMNMYWVEYHFFLQYLVSVLYMPKTKPLNYTLLNELFNEYYSNLEIITHDIKQDFWPEKGLGSSILSDMANFYKKQGDKDKYDVIKERGKSLGWRL